ncbi:MAG TPA: glycosyltransferase [Candidatus Methylomirabilis sp.]|nr:glycosyltransferase [Candidatus Methylomirabilis sp.]
MRIGLFTNNYRPLVNGLATSVESFAHAFRRAGHAVTIVAPRYSGGSAPEPDVLRVPGLRAPTHHAYVLPMAWSPGVGRAVAALRLDVFHAQHPTLLGAAAARWARRSQRPLIFTYHTYYDRYAHYVPGPSTLVARMAIRQATAFANRADVVIAPGPSVAKALRTQGVTAPIAIVPTGVTLPGEAEEAKRIRRRQALGLNDGTPLCLSVGRLAREKNQAFLLAAFAAVVTRLPAARLILVGEGDDRPRLEKMRRDLDLGESVRFVGAVPHERVGEYYLAADMFLFPSTSETQGVVILEAMAAGLPVVAVASDAAVDLLGDSEAGVMTPEDRRGFAGTVGDLWGQPERRRAMAAVGRRIAAGYAPETCAAKLLGLYEEVVRARRISPLGATAVRPREA